MFNSSTVKLWCEEKLQIEENLAPEENKNNSLILLKFYLVDLFLIYWCRLNLELTSPGMKRQNLEKSREWKSHQKSRLTEHKHTIVRSKSFSKNSNAPLFQFEFKSFIFKENYRRRKLFLSFAERTDWRVSAFDEVNWWMI